MKKISRYMVIPIEIAHDKEISSSAKLLYGEILSLSQKTGVCYAKNVYFAEIYKTTPETISRLIKKLVDKQLIVSVKKYNGSMVESRVITPMIKISKETYEKDMGVMIKKSMSDDEKIKDNNKNNNIKIINTVVPSRKEIKEYSEEKGYKFDLEKFIEYNEGQNWSLGKGRFKTWQEAMDYWNKTERPKKEIKSEIKKDKQHRIEEEYEYEKRVMQMRHKRRQDEEPNNVYGSSRNSFAK